MRKLKVALALSFAIGVPAHASSINIAAISSDHKRHIVVEKEAQTDSVNQAIRGISRLNSYVFHSGDCRVTESKLKRRVSCISAIGDKIKVTTPNGEGNNYTILDISKLNHIEATSKIYQTIASTPNSPFGARLAYVSKNRSNNQYKMYVSSYDGTGSELMFSSSQPLLSPAWSYDGRYLAYVSYESVRSSIFVYDTITGKRVSVVSRRGLNAFPSFTPDNKLLISLSGEKDGSSIYEYNLLTKKTRILTDGKSADIFPIHRLNSTYFTRLHNDTPYLYRVDQSGKSVRVLSRPFNAPTTSHYGSLISGIVDGRLAVISGSKNTINKITKYGNIESPSFERTGNWIYFSRERDGFSEVAAVNSKGKEIVSFKLKNEDIIQVSAY